MLTGGGKSLPSSASSAGRLEYLDAIKGIAILLVLVGHVYLRAGLDDSSKYYSYVLQFLQAVHMPLFFIIAGYFSGKALDLSLRGIFHYWRDKFVRLLLPALAWYPLLRLLQYGVPVLGGIAGFEYWFMVHLFLAMLLFYAQRLVVEGGLRLLRRSSSIPLEVLLHLGVLLLLLVAYRTLPLEGLPGIAHYGYVFANLDCLYPYLVLGFALRRLNWLHWLQRAEVGAVAFVLLVISLGVIRAEELDVPYLRYGQLHICRLLALSCFAYLVYAMTLLMARGGRMARWLVFLGKWSLPIYMTHYFFLPHFYGLREYLSVLPAEQRIAVELGAYGLGVGLTLLLTLPVIWLIKCNPYLDYVLYGEKDRFKR